MATLHFTLEYQARSQKSGTALLHAGGAEHVFVQNQALSTFLSEWLFLSDISYSLEKEDST